MKYLIQRSALTLMIVSLSSPVPAQGFFESVGKAIEKGVQDAGKAIEKGAQDTGRAVEKGVQDAGKAIEKGVQDTGKAIEKGAQDTGKTVEKAAQDTGKTLEKAAHDTGNTVDQAGQDIGQFGRDLNQATLQAGRDINATAIHFGKELERGGKSIGEFFEWAVNFDLSCSDPASAPSSIAKPYQAQCSGQHVSFKQNADLCVSAGGVSMIVAATASSYWTFGASLALAKAAFEICEQACRDEAALNNCIAKVDREAANAETTADMTEREARNLSRRKEALECHVEALDDELLWSYVEIVRQCEISSECHPNEPDSESWILERMNAAKELYERQRMAAFEAFEAGRNLDEDDYGPTS